jgi:hypothetical protein
MFRWCIAMAAGMLGLQAAASGAQLRVSPSVVGLGEPAVVTVSGAEANAAVTGSVVDPTGVSHALAFTRQADGWTATFTGTTVRAFLGKDWNLYSVTAEVAEASAQAAALKADFSLDDRAKTLYFVFWIDDFGAGRELDPSLVDWYHREAGPIAYLLQHDDTRAYDVHELLSRYDFKRDYLGHHFHVFRWPGSRVRLWLNNHLYARFLDFRRLVNGRAGFELVRVGTVGGALAAVAILLFVSARRRRSGALAAGAGLLLLAALSLALLRVNFMKIHDWHNWSFEFDNPAWCHDFLEEARAEFRASGQEFPPVVRHGWNLPPRCMARDYMTEFGVLSDASAISGVWTNNYLDTFGYPGRTVVWRDDPRPYYASATGDFNQVWSGAEPDRGVLELPLTFPNAQLIKPEEIAPALARMPHGALVSTYLHPHDDPALLKGLVAQLKSTYADVRFIRPDEYVELYLKHKPRPVLIEEDGTAYWAYAGEANTRPIRQTGMVHLRKGDGGLAVEVNTEAPLPLLEIRSAGHETLRLTNVSPGRHDLKPTP